MSCSRLMVDPNDLAIVVIDVQPYFLEGWMAAESEPLLARLKFLFALATVYDVPFLATFEQSIETKGSVTPSRPSTAVVSTRFWRRSAGWDESRSP